ncbi:MAG: hypothetical protein M1815_002416 [Lichina confinis]|nr:MAG: hypothetical protein M1815_002416 [Lichina confinis]
MAKRVPIPRNGLDYRGKVVLAPMVRVGELPTRLLALKYGADLVWGPEIVDRALIGAARRENRRTSTVDFVRTTVREGGPDSEKLVFHTKPAVEKRRLIYQLGTASPELAVEAASIVAADVSGIDVNAGCPKPFSVKGGMGAALLKTPDTLCAILEALVERVGNRFEIGISVKIRILETPEMTAELVRRLCGTGIIGLTVHCRTQAMRKHERVVRDQLKMVADICREHGVASVMNGDVVNRDQALELIEEYAVDSAMIAIAASHNPSCFRTEADGGLADWQAIANEYLTTALDVHNPWFNTKYTLSQMLPGKTSLHRLLMSCTNYKSLCAHEDMKGLMSAAEAVDATQMDTKKRRSEGQTSADQRPKSAEERQQNPSKRLKKSHHRTPIAA